MRRKRDVCQWRRLCSLSEEKECFPRAGTVPGVAFGFAEALLHLFLTWLLGRGETGPLQQGMWGSLSFQCCLLSIHMAPGALFFRLVCLPRKGQAQVSQKLEAHTLGLSHRNDEERQAGSNQGLQHSGAGVGAGDFFCLLENQVL